jgi:hypothetical protein
MGWPWGSPLSLPSSFDCNECTVTVISHTHVRFRYTADVARRAGDMNQTISRRRTATFRAAAASAAR